MKRRRTYGVVILLYIVTLGLFWWMWQSTRPDSVVSPTASTQGTAQPASASANAKKVTLTFVPVATPAANDANQTPIVVAEVASAAPAKADPPVQHSAIITVPLAQAEHHLFNQGKDEFSIMGVYDATNSSGNVVDMYVWHNSNGSSRGYIFGGLISTFSVEEQAYINSWEQQQQQAAAASNSTTPQLATPTPPEAPYDDNAGRFNSETLAYINSLAQQAAVAFNSTTPQLTADTPWMVHWATELGGNVLLEELNQRVQNGEPGAQILSWLNAVARTEATPAPQPQSAPDTTDPEPTAQSVPQQGPQIITSPQN